MHFPHGVASGDPQPDGVVIWTRPEDKRAPGQGATVRAQMSKTPGFASMIVDEQITVGPASDNCLRLHVTGLDPDTEYFYRFMAGPAFSRTGRTRTAPEPGADVDVRYAFASCQNFEQAFYGAWARMLTEDAKLPPHEQLKFVLFLGDFIYEVRGDRWDADMRDPKWLRDAAGRLREIPPFPDGSKPWPSTSWNVNPGATNAVSLADYRHLYKLYLRDPHLQAARARWPFVCTWDDHEFSNDGWQSHDTYFDGPGVAAQKRKAAANKAWFEFIPAVLSDARATAAVPNPAHDFRAVTVNDTAFGPPAKDSTIHPNPDNLAALESLTIYRALRWGKRLELFLTDNRSYKSQPLEIPKDAAGKRPPLPPVEWVRILDAGRTADGGKPPAALPGTDVKNPRADYPAGSVLGPEQKAWFKAALKNSDAQWKVWANSFPGLPIRIDMSSIPFFGLHDSCLGLDGWNGYPSERQELLDFIKAEGVSNVLSCAGDHHAHLAGGLVADLSKPGSAPAALEFACAGISSEPLFPGVVRAASGNAVFAALVSFQREGRTIENWHRALLYGVYSALLTAATGSETVGDLYRRLGMNPGLLFLDTNSNGYGLASLSKDAGEVTLVSTGAAVTDHGAEGAPVVRKSVFRFKPWSPGASPDTPELQITGAPLYPFA